MSWNRIRETASRLIARLQAEVERRGLDGDEAAFDGSAVQRVCVELGAPCVFSHEDVEHADYMALDGQVFTLPFDPSYDSPKAAEEFVSNASEEDSALFGGVALPDLNAEFWAPGGRPPFLYHATTAENVESILEDGLGPRCETRGISNRCVGSAVFTSLDVDELRDGTYGEAIFRIDTGAMLRDGILPPLTLEPDVEEKQWRDALAWRVGLEDFHWEIEHGMSENTIVVHGHIPPGYLMLLGDDLRSRLHHVAVGPVHGHAMGDVVAEKREARRVVVWICVHDLAGLVARVAKERHRPRGHRRAARAS
jgi:hypothetical protein